MINVQEMIAYFLSVCSTDFLPIVVPLLAYFIYSSRRFQNSLKGQVVLITGANSGIGEALSHVFYKEGCKLILVGRRKDELERVKADLQKTKTNNETFEPMVLIIDLSKIETVPQQAKEAIAIHNKINILINNAGISHRGNILETSMNVQMNIMAVNYFGTIVLTQALLPSLIESKGHVVAMSSVQGRLALPDRSAYAASKHALQAYMDCLRSEIPSIKVTVINPGYVKTNLSVNAITATGEKYGVLDQATASGYSASYIAEETLKAIIKEKKEVTIAPLWTKMAILCRVLTPSLIFYFMKLRAKKNK